MILFREAVKFNWKSVSDGSKCDSSNILDILGKDNSIAVTDPVYPVYVDSNVMTGRTGNAFENGTYQGLTYLATNEGNNFLPELPEKKLTFYIFVFLIILLEQLLLKKN